MKIRLSTGLAAGVVMSVLLAAPALAGPTVSIRIEGATHTLLERTQVTLPDTPPPVLSPEERQALPFPALPWLDAILARMPAESLKILVFVPVHVAAQPRIRDDVAADPEQPREIDPGGRRRFDVEHVERIDERDELAARCRRREHLQGEARPARRARTDDFRNVPARQPAADPCV